MQREEENKTKTKRNECATAGEVDKAEQLLRNGLTYTTTHKEQLKIQCAFDT